MKLADPINEIPVESKKNPLTFFYNNRCDFYAHLRLANESMVSKLCFCYAICIPSAVVHLI